MTHNRDHGANRKSGRKQQCGGGQDPAGQTGTERTQETDEYHGADGQQCFTQPDLISENAVTETEPERIAQKEAGKQRYGGYVGPENRHIRQEHKPQRNEAEVLSSDALLKCIDTARIRGLTDHVLQIPGNYQYDRHAEQEAEDRAQNSGFLQIGIAGHDK